MIVLKKYFIACLFIVLAVKATSQNLATTIKVQAMDMASSWMKNDFEKFSAYMHPELIKNAGGKERMKANLDSVHVNMKRFKVRVKRYWIDDPGEIVKYKNQLQAVLPISITLEMVLGEMESENAMIVISNDNGKNWWFIDTNIYPSEKLKNAAIELSPQLVIPARAKPKLIPKKNE